MPRRARTALIGAATGVALLAAVWYAAHYIAPVRAADASILNGFVDLTRPRLDRLTTFIADLCNPNEYVFLAALPVIVALVRGRPRVAAMLAIVLLCANETTQLLKPLLAGPRDPVHWVPIGSASWPSGHATAAMSLALCSVIAAPARRAPGGGGGDGGVRHRGELLVPGARLALPVRRPRRLPRRRHLDAAGDCRPVDRRGADPGERRRGRPPAPGLVLGGRGAGAGRGAGGGGVRAGGADRRPAARTRWSPTSAGTRRSSSARAASAPWACCSPRA